MKCLKQIQSIKNLSIPVFIGGGIDEEKANKIINLLNPEGIDVSRNLKNSKNIISSKKLKNFLHQVAAYKITAQMVRAGSTLYHCLWLLQFCETISKYFVLHVCSLRYVPAPILEG